MVSRYAVMGNPVQHSLSPIIHQLFAEQTGCQLQYDKIQIDLDSFEQQVRDFFNAGGQGLNITLPCKQRAFAMCDKVTDRCLQARAANTLWQKAGKLHADNTDGIGLLRDLRRHMDLSGKRILLLGAGGAARGILGPLLDALPAKLTIANRTLTTALELQDDFKQRPYVSNMDELTPEYDLIINATSASFGGTFLELPAHVIGHAALCYDLSYGTSEATPFVDKARRLGCFALDGLGMLIEQAAEAFFIWHGVMPIARDVLAKIEKNP
ncbi:MAG: shikimate dehydrogenase [Legionellaceae bacterium]|nr:shikimate dehydrogenase [Legionellaceae bacterium]